MATLKYSRQRASIKKYLMSTTEHPTADTVYLHVREEFPHISLGTVYRNLNLLADTGEAVKYLPLTAVIALTDAQPPIIILYVIHAVRYLIWLLGKTILKK